MLAQSLGLEEDRIEDLLSSFLISSLGLVCDGFEFISLLGLDANSQRTSLVGRAPHIFPCRHRLGLPAPLGRPDNAHFRSEGIIERFPILL